MLNYRRIEKFWEDYMSNKYQDDTLKIFSLNGNRPLAEKIAKVFGTELGKAS